MGVFSFLNRHKASEASPEAQMMRAALSSLEVAMLPAQTRIDQEIPRWDLSDSTLLLLLGYLAGYVDAAYQSSQPKVYDVNFVEGHFIDQAEKFLSGIPGADNGIRFAREAASLGSSTIAGLQSERLFMDGMQLGGNDFVKLIHERRTPVSLWAILGIRNPSRRPPGI